MRIEVCSDVETQPKVPDTLLLEPVAWNDWWDFSNLYYARYVSRSGQTLYLGQVKVQDPAGAPQENPVHPLDVGFSGPNLPSNLVSLGQDDAYYEALAKLPELERADLCEALRDAVWDPRRLSKNKANRAVRTSLLRSVSYSSVLGEYHRIVRNEGEANYYRLVYTKSEFDIEFIVDPQSKPRTNLHTVIGRNGVGKTTLLRDITRLLATGDASIAGSSLAIYDEDGNAEGVLAGVQYVSWSAFDSFPEDQDWDFSQGVAYSKVGVTGIWQSTPDGKLERPAVVQLLISDENNPDDGKPVDSFIRSFLLVIERRRSKIWNEALESLESDPVFKRLEILKDLREMLAEAIEGDTSRITYENLSEAFGTLSDGHKVVLLTITYIAATLAERTLVVLDEPEAHLHPPLLASLIRCLNEMLIKKNAIAIVATHSPVVLQEVPKTCARKILRNRRGILVAIEPEIETYGEDVGALTHEVFGLEVADSGFYAALDELASRHDSFDQAIAELGGHLGVMGRSVLRSLIASEHRGTSE